MHLIIYYSTLLQHKLYKNQCDSNWCWQILYRQLLSFPLITAHFLACCPGGFVVSSPGWHLLVQSQNNLNQNKIEHKTKLWKQWWFLGKGSLYFPRRVQTFSTPAPLPRKIKWTSQIWKVNRHVGKDGMDCPLSHLHLQYLSRMFQHSKY